MVKFVGINTAIALSVAATIAMTMAAQAGGALAVGVDKTQARQLLYGWAADFPNEGEAKYAALLQCMTTEGHPGPTARAACRLVTVFNKQCMSFAWDTDPDLTGWGWAVHNDKSSAEKQAIDKCNAMPGASRTGYCVTERTVCDTIGSGAPDVATAPSSTVPVSMVTSRPPEVKGGGGAKRR